MTIPAEKLDNSHDPVFQNEFFNRFAFRKAKAPLQLSDHISREYLFPTFYGDVTCAIAIFMCSYAKAEALVAKELHPEIKPVKMTRGRSIIAFSCYEYKNVMGIAPYNEIAIAIPIMVNTGFRPPLLPMILKSFKHFGYFIAGMPVTSLENQIRGNSIWGLPKVNRDIDIVHEGDDCVTRAYEETGENYITLRVPIDGTPTEFDETSYLYTRLNNTLYKSQTNFKSNFKVKKYMNLLFKKNAEPDRTYIEIGNSKSAQLLKGLEIEPHPFQFRYTEGMSSCFDLPGDIIEPWFEEIGGGKRSW